MIPPPQPAEKDRGGAHAPGSKGTHTPQIEPRSPTRKERYAAGRLSPLTRIESHRMGTSGHTTIFARIWRASRIPQLEQSTGTGPRKKKHRRRSVTPPSSNAEKGKATSRPNFLAAARSVVRGLEQRGRRSKIEDRADQSCCCLKAARLCEHLCGVEPA